jgi:hypothetical protein
MIMTNLYEGAHDSVSDCGRAGADFAVVAASDPIFIVLPLSGPGTKEWMVGTTRRVVPTFTSFGRFA